MIWHRNVGALSQHFRAYAVDMVGEMNKSIPTRRIRNHLEFIGWIVGLLDGLQLKSTHLVGNSHGGFFALSTALHLPERVRKVVAISPAAIPLAYLNVHLAYADWIMCAPLAAWLGGRRRSGRH